MKGGGLVITKASRTKGTRCSKTNSRGITSGSPWDHFLLVNGCWDNSAAEGLACWFNSNVLLRKSTASEEISEGMVGFADDPIYKQWVSPRDRYVKQGDDTPWKWLAFVWVVPKGARRSTSRQQGILHSRCLPWGYARSASPPPAPSRIPNLAKRTGASCSPVSL